KRHRFFQRGGQLMQFTAHARLECLIIRVVRGGGADRGWIFRVKIAPPINMIAQEFDHQLFQQRVMFAVGAEEAGVEDMVAYRIGGEWRSFGHTVCALPVGYSKAAVYMLSCANP